MITVEELTQRGFTWPSMIAPWIGQLFEMVDENYLTV
jgi:hypothetical protein